jgi:hypothetical protein
VSRRRRRASGAPRGSDAREQGGAPEQGGARHQGGARQQGGARRQGGVPASGSPSQGPAPGRPPNKISFAGQVALLVAVFAATVGLAELFGAANLGVAFGIGQIVFAIVLVALLLRA